MEVFHPAIHVINQPGSDPAAKERIIQQISIYMDSLQRNNNIMQSISAIDSRSNGLDYIFSKTILNNQVN